MLFIRYISARDFPRIAQLPGEIRDEHALQMYRIIRFAGDVSWDLVLPGICVIGFTGFPL